MKKISMYHNNLNKEKGITLIALIITIIVLLILAGVSIATITGENGLLERAKNAKEKTTISENDEKEKINSAKNVIDNFVVGSRETVTISKEEYEKLQKKSILLEKVWGESPVACSYAEWKVIDEVSLAGYGKGKAIISYSSSSREIKASCLHSMIVKNNTMICIDGDLSPSAVTWVQSNANITTTYDENTTIKFRTFMDAAGKPGYSYSILLLPD